MKKCVGDSGKSTNGNVRNKPSNNEKIMYQLEALQDRSYADVVRGM